MELEEILFVLVHDAWHGAWSWQNLIEWLARRGATAVALDLPGHGDLYQAAETPGSYSLALYANAVVDFVRQHQAPARKIVLVGHGTAGPVLQLAAEELKDQVAGLIFVGAYVLNNGETIAGQMPPEMAQLFEQLAASRPDRHIPMDALPEYWRFNVISDDLRRADEILSYLLPEPVAPLFEPIHLKSSKPSCPCAYVSLNEDMSLPPGDFYPRMSGKLGPHRHMSVNAGHEGPLTKPHELAEALIFLGQHGLR